MLQHARRHSDMSCAKWLNRSRCRLVLTRMDRKKHVLHGGAHWRNLTNTTEPSVCSGDAALCQITLTACYGRPVE